jgi:hypothetical protein
MFDIGRLTCEAAPAKLRQVQPGTKHSWALKNFQTPSQQYNNFIQRIRKKSWFKGISSKYCPYTLEISRPNYDQIPQHYVEAKCVGGCNTKDYCKEISYHMLVRRRTGSIGMHWTSIRVVVAYVYQPSTSTD